MSPEEVHDVTHLDFEVAPPGTVRRGALTPDLGHTVEFPYVVVRGRRPGPTLLVTAGVHGAEYASIEASDRIAAWLTDGLLRRVDPYVDMHGGDMIESLTPFSIFEGEHDGSRELARAFGLPLAVAGSGTGMTYAAAAAHGVPAVLAEAGGQGRWPETAIRPLVDGTARVMAYLGMTNEAPPAGEFRFLTDFAWLRSEHTGLWYPDVEGGDTVAEGQELGTVRDPHGEVLQRAVAPLAGTVLFAVSSLAMNADDPLLGTGGA